MAFDRTRIEQQIKQVERRLEKKIQPKKFKRIYVASNPFYNFGDTQPIARDTFCDGEKFCNDYLVDSTALFEDLKKLIQDKAVLQIIANSLGAHTKRGLWIEYQHYYQGLLWDNRERDSNDKKPGNFGFELTEHDEYGLTKMKDWIEKGDEKISKNIKTTHVDEDIDDDIPF